MRTIVATLSVVNVIAGVGLAVLYFVDASPPVVAVASGVLVVQGLFTLALIGGAFGEHSDVARHIQLVGSTLALLVGAAGMLNGMATSLAANNTDPEYGPMTIAMLLAIHGLFSLLAFGRSDRDVSTRQAIP